jgi:transposase
MKTISLDLRKRIVDAVDKGDSTQLGIARRFGVSLGFVKKLLSQRSRTGSIENLHHRAGRKQSVTPEQQNAIRVALESITPEDAAGWLTSCGYKIS